MRRLAVPTLAALALACAPAAAPADEWLAGDGHVHTCYSHDSYCPPADDNTGPDTLYSSMATVQQRFAEGAAKGLDFLVISDHNDVRAWSDPAFGSSGVLGVRAYEHSLPGGHAHVIGAKRLIDTDSATVLREQAHADGALFQANHPTYRAERDVAGCDDVRAGGDGSMDWSYGFSVRPDTLEVWNATALLRTSETVWECFLQEGWRMPATAGSDSHGGNQPTLGMPTLWVLARDRSEAAIVDAMRHGRTTITKMPPSLGAVRLLLEADGDRDGDYEATMGDTVRPGTPMRVRSDGLTLPADLRVRANGATLVEQPLLPGETVEFAAPREPGWVRATLVGEQRTHDLDPNCASGTPAPVDMCTADHTYQAMTSPIYVSAETPTKAKKPKKPKKAKKR